MVLIEKKKDNLGFVEVEHLEDLTKDELINVLQEEVVRIKKDKTSKHFKFLITCDDGDVLEINFKYNFGKNKNIYDNSIGNKEKLDKLKQEVILD